MLTLSEAELKELNDFLQEMPVKYGLPLINYLNARIKKEIPTGVGGENVTKEKEE